jgi:hypothetical protein
LFSPVGLACVKEQTIIVPESGSPAQTRGSSSNAQRALKDALQRHGAV